MDTPQETVEVAKDEAVDRKALLAEQFEAAEAEAPTGRDEQGRFAKTVKAEEPAPEPAEEPVWKRPPASWKKEYHEAWQKADPRIQEYAWQREEQMRKGIEPLISKKQFADAMEAAIEPYRQTITGLGLKPEQAVSALMKADYTLRTSDPQTRMQYFAQLAQEYGIDLGSLTGGQAYQPQTSADPLLFALKNELASVKGEVLTWKQQQEAVEQAKMANEIDSFSTKAEFFEEARPTMIQLLQSGMAETLEDAYDKALRLDSELSERIQQSRQAELEKKQSAEKNRAAKAARAAAVSVRSATPGTNTAPKAHSRRALLEEMFNEQESRL